MTEPITEPTAWLARQKRATKTQMVTIVNVRCSRPSGGHLVASIHPILPAILTPTHLGIWLRSARYRAGLAAYAHPGSPLPTDTGWVTLTERALVLPVEDIARTDWSVSATWACRCGIGVLNANELADEVYGWLLESGREDTPALPRTLQLQGR